jgi:hypothetical protein
MKGENLKGKSIYPIFIILPAILVTLGLIFFPFRVYESDSILQQILTITLFFSLLISVVKYYRFHIL